MNSDSLHSPVTNLVSSGTFKTIRKIFPSNADHLREPRRLPELLIPNKLFGASRTSTGDACASNRKSRNKSPSAMKRSNSLVRRNSAHAAGDDDDSTLSLRLTSSRQEGQNTEDTANSSLVGKRKKPEYQPGRFKAVSQLVLAMNRFKGTDEQPNIFQV